MKLFGSDFRLSLSGKFCFAASLVVRILGCYCSRVCEKAASDGCRRGQHTGQAIHCYEVRMTVEDSSPRLVKLRQLPRNLALVGLALDCSSPGQGMPRDDGQAWVVFCMTRIHHHHRPATRGRFQRLI
jgi:hypothetical protein